jgi:pimeloyl-ACP methyl ester carboxylesterase
MEVKEWSEKGKMISVLGSEVFVIDEGNSENTLVILHGYATSSIDFAKVLPELTKHYRVIIQDFIGFGFSDKPMKYYLNILEQTDTTLELWRLLELKNITLLGHNYGASIALEILTRKRTSLLKIDIQNLIFLNSTISFDYKNESEDLLNPLQEFSKRIQLMLTSFSFFKMKIKDFFFDSDTLSENEIKARWILIEHKDGREIVDFLSNYSTESKILWNRWYTSLNLNTLPAKIICGKNDIIFDEHEAVLFSEELRNSSLHLIDNCGHYPMLEKPDELIQLILE